MMQIFLIQLLAAGLGALSTAWADWCYNRARIGGRLHAFWVSASIAAICLPVLAWISTVFFGPGLLGQSIASILVGAIFLWVYRNLPNPPVRKIGPEAPGRPSSGAVPPASRLNR